ncbi:unnamed protein product [Bemisia tabaci]|uniref:tRNA (adenine(58)-N(1))-methyltransferase n=1 Tax=Bemisia tabaci TaxID=7038 RepID=A0A9P0G490_BEMTA|nr:unnamed protein product [Bemisia tabaci]
MSFSQLKETIEEGDTVILYLNPLNLHSIEVKPEIPNKHDELVDNVFQTKYGALKIKGLIGQKFGSKVSLSKGWAYVLHPTPELWTLTLPHRTQIIYSADISMIIFQLDLKPGCIVIESGTGSGSLTHALARTVSPNGTVHTFDFHKQRAAIAEAEFAGHKIDSVVKSYHRDVCQLGFGPDLDSLADAVFLDLPLPWTVVPHAVKVIKKSAPTLLFWGEVVLSEEILKDVSGDF